MEPSYTIVKRSLKMRERKIDDERASNLVPPYMMDLPLLQHACNTAQWEE